MFGLWTVAGATGVGLNQLTLVVQTKQARWSYPPTSSLAQFLTQSGSHCLGLLLVSRCVVLILLLSPLPLFALLFPPVLSPSTI